MEEQSNEAVPVAFLPVSVKEATPSNLTVLVNDKLRIEISAGFDPNTLKQVVQTLQAS